MLKLLDSFSERLERLPMKKSNALKIKFRSLDQWEKELLNLPKSKKGYVQPKDVVIFDSLNSFRNFMTLQKLELLTIIASAKPKSVYELSKMLDRALGPVQNDCKGLEGLGFIILEQEKSGRKTIIPKLKFNYDRIIVELPDHHYELSFKAAA